MREPQAPLDSQKGPGFGVGPHISRQRKITPSNPGELRSCPQVAHKLSKVAPGAYIQRTVDQNWPMLVNIWPTPGVTSAPFPTITLHLATPPPPGANRKFGLLVGGPRSPDGVVLRSAGPDLHCITIAQTVVRSTQSGGGSGRTGGGHRSGVALGFGVDRGWTWGAIWVEQARGGRSSEAPKDGHFALRPSVWGLVRGVLDLNYVGQVWPKGGLAKIGSAKAGRGWAESQHRYDRLRRARLRQCKAPRGVWGARILGGRLDLEQDTLRFDQLGSDFGRI